jgi:hypothetical protein
LTLTGHEEEQGEVMTEETKRTYFAIRPLATGLICITEAPIQAYESGKGLAAPVSKSFQAIDIEVWARQFLQAMDDFLSSLPPDYQAEREIESEIEIDACRSLRAEAERAGGLWPDVKRVANAGGQLAEAIAGGVDHLFQVPADPQELERARKGVKRALLHGLSAGYATDALFESPAILLYTHETPSPRMRAEPSDTRGEGIPVPLRIQPAAPALLSQSGVKAGLSPSNMLEARRWNYEFTFESHTEEQDTIYVTVGTYPNGARVQLRQADWPPPLFSDLARFIEAYPAIKPDLPVPLNPDNTDTGVAGPAVKAFADIAKAVAEGWKEHHRKDTGHRRSLADDEPAAAQAAYTYRLEKRFKGDGDSLTLDAITLRVVGDAARPTDRWPSLWVLASDGEYRRLIREPVGGDECVYKCEGQSPLSDGFIIRFGFEDLDVIQTPTMMAAVRVARNENLGYDPPVNTAFVHHTETVKFVVPFMASTRHAGVVEMERQTTDLAADLSLFFCKLFEKAAIALSVKLLIRYHRVLKGDVSAPETDGLDVFLPVTLVPPVSFQEDLGKKVAEAVRKWSKENAPGEPGDFEMSVEVFAASSKAPVLTLDRVTFSLDEM